MPAMNQPLPVMNPWEQSHLGFHCEQTGSTRVRTQSSVGAHPSLLHGQGQKLATLALQPSSFLSPLLTSCFTWEWSPMHLCSTPHSHASQRVSANTHIPATQCLGVPSPYRGTASLAPCHRLLGPGCPKPSFAVLPGLPRMRLLRNTKLRICAGGDWPHATYLICHFSSLSVQP